MRLALQSVALLVLFAACSRRQPTATDGSRPHDATPAASAPSDGAAASAVPVDHAAVDAAAPPPPLAVEAKGMVGLVLQHVEAVCIAGVGANGKAHFTVGTDLLLETLDESGAKPSREHVFCPKQLADGGPEAPRLDIWRNCRRDQTCTVVSTDAGDGPVEIVCGKDRVTLETTSGRTILRGPFGEREIAPAPMKVAPPKRERRDALVDC